MNTLTATAKAVGFTHDSVANKSVDWYTPPWVFDALGLEFDLDPCQPESKIPWIPAKRHYCLADDGLAKAWDGLVWLNPPYGKFTPDWLEKMHKHRNGIALVFARTDCKWFHDYCAKADAILFLSGRIKFVDGLCITGGNGAGSGSMLIAWGEQSVSALEAMKERGLFMRMDDADRAAESVKPAAPPVIAAAPPALRPAPVTAPPSESPLQMARRLHAERQSQP